MLRDSVAVTVVVRTRPQAIPLAMIIMRKSTHGFCFLSCMGMGRRSSAIKNNDVIASKRLNLKHGS